jgi:ABC-type glycerol-3-phosphate transport system substrate-binding protein
VLTDFVLKAPGVAQIADYFWKFLNNDRELRLMQSQNAAQLVSSGNATVTDAATFAIPGADNSQQRFSLCIVVTDEDSGKGRFEFGKVPTAAGDVGAPFPSGGAYVPIRGNDQIRKFLLIGETGETLNVWWGLYQ